MNTKMNRAFARVWIDLESLDLMLDSVLKPASAPTEYSEITITPGLATPPTAMDPRSLAQLWRLAEAIEIDLREGHVIQAAASVAPSIVPGRILKQTKSHPRANCGSQSSAASHKLMCEAKSLILFKTAG